jgi:hypothetical protein
MPVTEGLEDLTHLDAIGIMANAYARLAKDPASTKGELREAMRVLSKAEDYQLSLTDDDYSFNH